MFVYEKEKKIRQLHTSIRSCVCAYASIRFRSLVRSFVRVCEWENARQTRKKDRKHRSKFYLVHIANTNETATILCKRVSVVLATGVYFPHFHFTLMCICTSFQFSHQKLCFWWFFIFFIFFHFFLSFLKFAIRIVLISNTLTHSFVTEWNGKYPNQQRNRWHLPLPIRSNLLFIRISFFFVPEKFLIRLYF